MPEMKVMLFKSTKIRVDENGLVCLNDIHTAAGFSKNQGPGDWVRLPSAQKEMTALLKSITGKSRNWEKEEIRAVLHSRAGSSGGTWAHENMALGYASYLSASLAIEIRDVFLRFKKGDETLHEEIRENKRRRDEAFDRHREIGKRVRRDYTNTLQLRGVKNGFEFANCTNELYKHLLGGTAKELRVKKKLHPKASLRDNMSLSELAFTMASEALAVERIEHQEAHGYVACKTETRLAAQSIHGAIEGDRKNRLEKLV